MSEALVDDKPVGKASIGAEKLSKPKAAKASVSKAVTTPSPSKRALAQESQETPEGKRSRPDGFGGVCGRARACRVCEKTRLENQRGGCCDFCLLACRKLYQHQRISEVVAENKALEAVKLKSLELGAAAAANPPQPKHDRQGVAELVKVVKQLVVLVPRLDERLAKLEASLLHEK